MFAWPDSANQFGKKVKEFGYLGDDEGVCHGVACVAAHEGVVKLLLTHGARTNERSKQVSALETILLPSCCAPMVRA